MYVGLRTGGRAVSNLPFLVGAMIFGLVLGTFAGTLLGFWIADHLITRAIEAMMKNAREYRDAKQLPLH